MPGLTNDAANFVNQVSAATGIDTRVLIAWIEAEDVTYATTGGGGGTGHFNYLNLRPYPGDPYSGQSPGGFEEFGSVQDAVTATVKRIKQPFAAPIVQGAMQHDTPRQEIAAIAGTGWDAGHYGGNGGVKLDAVFSGLFGPAGLDSPYQRPDYSTAATVGTGSAADWTSTDITGSGGGPSAVGAAKGAASAVESAVGGAVGGLFSGLEGALVRFGFIVGGIAIGLVGLYLIARSFNAAPSPSQIVGGFAGAKSGGAAGAAAGASRKPAQEDTGGGEGAPRRQGDAAIARGEPVTRAGLPQPNTARQNRQAARRARPRPPGRGQPGSSKLARGDEIPF